ncbi:MAG: zinc ribbon domain-containing protein, partial [Candidatus Altiarchaeota archaeon]|nr:zinc ribbon domain-containing protein [Candidatus Altiarchaeota archaeon]
MAICKNCGSGIPEGAKFCTKCGKQAEVSAPVAILPQTDVKAGKNAKMPPVFFLIIIVVGIVAVLAFILLGSQQPITAC